jgi:hypothetical protein
VVCDQIVSRENKATIFELHIVINVLVSKSMLTLQKKHLKTNQAKTITSTRYKMPQKNTTK